MKPLDALWIARAAHGSSWWDAFKDESPPKGASLEARARRHAFEPLSRALRSDDLEVQQAAAWALERLGRKEGIPPLIEALDARHPTTRRAVERALMALGRRCGLEPLTRALIALNDPERRLEAAHALTRAPDTRATSQLIRALSDDRREVQIAAIEALGAIQDPRVIPALLGALERGKWAVRLAALRALGASGDARAVASLRGALEEGKTALRRAAVEGLVALRGVLGEAALIEALVTRDEDGPRLRIGAVEVLGGCVSPAAMDPLLHAFGDLRPEVREAAAVALSRRREPMARAAAGLLEPRRARAEAAIALRGYVEPRLIAPLLHALNTPDRLARQEVMITAVALCRACGFEILLEATQRAPIAAYGGVGGVTDLLEALCVLGGVEVTRALIARIDLEDYPSARVALEALMRVGGVDVVRCALELLEEPRRWAQEIAARILARWGGVEIVEPLIAALGSPWWQVRYFAAEGLGRVGDRRATLPLIARLPYREEVTLRALTRLRDARAIPALLEALRGDDWELAVNVAQVLEGAGDWEGPSLDIVATLLEILKEGRARLGLLKALGRLGGARATPFLIRALSDANFRSEAIRALMCVEDPRIPGAFTEALERNPSLATQSERAYQAAFITWAPELATRRFIKGLSGKHPERAAKALGELGSPSALEPLVEMSKCVNMHHRRAAVRALGELGERRAIEPLRACLEDEDNHTRVAAAVALARLGDLRGLEVLTALVNGEGEARWAAIQSLGDSGHPAALEPLIALAEEPSVSARRAATRALGALGDPRALPTLAKLMRSGFDTALRHNTVKALRALGGVEGLLIALGEASDGTERLAIEALIALDRAEALRPLIRLVVEDPRRRRGAAEALAGLRARALEALGEREAVLQLTHGNVSVCFTAARALWAEMEGEGGAL